MAAYDTLTAADRDTIARQIAEGGAPVDSWGRPAAGGSIRPDDAREYFCHLASARTGAAGPMRVVRVTVFRDAVGRWTIGDVDTFTADAGQEPTRRDDDRWGDITAAVEQDDRQIVRQGAACIECA